jgi:hypothetical protein
MKMIRLISIFCLLTSNFYLLTSPLFAKDASIPPDFDKPVSVLFDPANFANDSSYPVDGSPLDLDTINNGVIVTKQVTAAALFHGSDRSRLKPNAKGKLEATAELLSSLGFDQATMEGKDYLHSVTKNTIAYKNQDITHLIREACVESDACTYETFFEWACQRDLCICGPSDCHINPSVFSNASQLTPLKDQLEEMLTIAETIIQCKDESAAGVTRKCSNYYTISSKTSLATAQMVLDVLDPNNLVDSFASLSEKEKYLVFSLHNNEASSTFVLIVPEKVDCGANIACRISEFINPEQPGYFKIIAPQTNNYKTGVIAANNRTIPLKDQLQAAASPKPLLAEVASVTDVTPSTELVPLYEALLAKAGSLTCSNPEPELIENLGASANPVKNQPSFSFNLSAFLNLNSQKEENRSYCVYIFNPPDLVDAQTALTGDNSLIRTLSPLKEVGQIRPVNIPIQYQDSLTGETIRNCDTFRDPDTQEVIQVCDDEYVSYNNGNAAIGLMGGDATTFWRFFLGATKPLKDAIEPDQCVLDYYHAGALNRGNDLKTDVNAAAYSQSACQNPILPRINPGTEQDSDICAVAAEYNIPCCQLEGIMALESGYGTPNFQPGTGPCGNSGKINCCNGIGCGPAQISCGQIVSFSGGESIDVCDPVGAATLLARAMKLKMCQADNMTCNTYNWDKEKDKAMTYEITDYTAAAYFHGLQNGCTLSGCAQFRWGAGKNYCDSVESYCNTGKILPDATDMNFCDACNVELINSGVKPMPCAL